MSEQCQNCESMVSDQFAKVHGDNDNNVYHCRECARVFGGRAFIFRGGAAYKDPEVVLERMKTTTPIE